MYEGRHRVAEPHTYGIDKKGRRALRAYQVAGSSSSPQLGWRIFHESSIRDLTLLSEGFTGTRPNYKRGDSDFRLIIAQL